MSPVRGSAHSKGRVSAPRTPPHRFLTLLSMELLVILAYPFTLEVGSRYDWFRLLVVMVLIAALYAALGRGRVTLVAFLLGTPAIVIRVANFGGHFQTLATTAVTLEIIFLGFVTVVFIWTVLSHPKVTADTLAGAIAAYLLVGITYGLAYGLIAQLSPSSFRSTVEPWRVIHPLWSRNSKGLESRGLQPRLVSSDCLAAKMSFLTLRRPMVCFVNVENVDRIIYSIFQRFNLEWKTRTLSVFTQAA
jgi:hypothetical protein